MSEYREGCIYAKKVKAGIVDVDSRLPRGKSQRPQPFVLYGFFKWLSVGPEGSWRKLGSYRDAETAHAAARNRAHKYSFYLRFRIGKDGAEFDPRK